MKKIGLVLAVVAVAAVFGALSAFAPAAAGKEALDKTAVEKIVADYIANNPEVILDSVAAYQRRSLEQRQQQAFDKYRADLFENPQDPVAGNKAGKITVIEFFDYNCGYCKRSLETIQTLLKENSDLRVVFKEFPILGPSSDLASQWAVAVHRTAPEKYFDFHAAVMASRGGISEEKLAAIAGELGLDASKLKQEAASPAIKDYLDNTRAMAIGMDITGTPAFIIGNELMPGAISIEDFRVKIETLRKASEG